MTALDLNVVMETFPTHFLASNVALALAEVVDSSVSIFTSSLGLNSSTITFFTNSVKALGRFTHSGTEISKVFTRNIDPATTK
jgi:hypothetical protein